MNEQDLLAQARGLAAEQEAAEALARTAAGEGPTLDHVWNGEAWVLPAEHEIVMLNELFDDGTIKAKDRDTLLRSAEIRLKEQREKLEDVE